MEQVKGKSAEVAKDAMQNAWQAIEEDANNGAQARRTEREAGEEREGMP